MIKAKEVSLRKKHMNDYQEGSHWFAGAGKILIVFFQQNK